MKPKAMTHKKRPKIITGRLWKPPTMSPLHLEAKGIDWKKPEK